MAPRPNYFLCFLGRLALIGILNFWLLSLGGMIKNPGMAILFLSMAGGHASSAITIAKDRWKSRHTKPYDAAKSRKSNLLLLAFGVVVLGLVEIWQYFRPSPTPAHVVLGALLFPFGVFLDFYLHEIGIERPLRKWYELQKVNISPDSSVMIATSANPNVPTVQRIGRP